jgi:hypothetical protein
MVCAIRRDSNIKGVKLSGEGDIDSLATKFCMFADDTQMINKDEDSLQKNHLMFYQPMKRFLGQK